MSVAAPTRVYTPDDLLTLPDSERYELVDGQLVELEMSMASSWIAGEVFGQLRDYTRRNPIGWAFPEGTSYIGFGWDGRRVRRPDASFILKERLPDGPLQEGHCTVIPDLVVEVVSPHDLYQDVEDKVAEYQVAGVRLIWVVNPSTHSIMIHRPGVQPRRLGDQDQLVGEDVLPDFRTVVASLFPPKSSDSSTAPHGT